MRVVVITGAWPPIQDGVGDYTAKLTASMKSVEVKTVTGQGAGSGADVLPIMKLWRWRELPRLIGAVSSLRPDVIHFQYHTRPYGRRLFTNFIPLLLRLRFFRTPVLVTIHEFSDASLLGKIRAGFTAWFASRVITVNAENAAGLHKLLRRHIENIGIGSNISVAPMSEKRRAELAQNYSIQPGRTAVYFGFIDPSKGVWQLVESFPSWPAESRLLIVTAFRPEDEFHQRLKRLISESSAAGRILWTGYLSDTDVSEVLQLADICILPFDSPATLRRGSMIAALIHGLPVITTGPVALPLKDGENLITTPDNHPDTITLAVNRLFSEEPLRRILRVNSLKLAALFDWNSIAEQHIDLYRHVARKP